MNMNELETYKMTKVRKMPVWDADVITQEISKILKTDMMISIDLRLTASTEELPVLEYTINRYVYKKGQNIYG